MERIFEFMNEIKEKISNDSSASMSNYPSEIDPLMFIEDAKISDYEWRKNYGNLLQDDVINAVETLANNGRFVPINAFLFNMLQDRIIATATYLLEKEDNMVRVEFDDEPEEFVEGKIWMIDKDDFFSSISSTENE